MFLVRLYENRYRNSGGLYQLTLNNLQGINEGSTEISQHVKGRVFLSGYQKNMILDNPNRRKIMVVNFLNSYGVRVGMISFFLVFGAWLYFYSRLNGWI